MVAGSERNGEIVRRYQAGETLAAIGARFGISAQAVQQILIRLGIPRRSGHGHNRGKTLATPEQAAEIRRRRADDESLTGIAAALGLTRGVVRNVLRANGIDTRDRRHINRLGQPRTCTMCLRSAAEGATFSPGERFNRCRDCMAARAREWYHQHRAGATRG